MTLLDTKITVNCPDSGFEEITDDKCATCQYYEGLNSNVEVMCHYSDIKREGEK